MSLPVGVVLTIGFMVVCLVLCIGMLYTLELLCEVLRLVQQIDRSNRVVEQLKENDPLPKEGE